MGKILSQLRRMTDKQKAVEQDALKKIEDMKKQQEGASKAGEEIKSSKE